MRGHRGHIPISHRTMETDRTVRVPPSPGDFHGIYPSHHPDSLTDPRIPSRTEPHPVDRCLSRAFDACRFAASLFQRKSPEPGVFPRSRMAQSGDRPLSASASRTGASLIPDNTRRLHSPPPTRSLRNRSHETERLHSLYSPLGEIQLPIAGLHPYRLGSVQRRPLALRPAEIRFLGHAPHPLRSPSPAIQPIQSQQRPAQFWFSVPRQFWKHHPDLIPAI